MNNLKEQIENFINSDEKNIKIDMRPVADIEKAFNELGYNRIDYDINGWQVDF